MSKKTPKIVGVLELTSAEVAMLQCVLMRGVLWSQDQFGDNARDVYLALRKLGINDARYHRISAGSNLWVCDEDR